MVQNSQSVCRGNIKAADTAGIQDHCPCLRRDMVCNVLLQDRDIGKKEITAKAVDQDTGNSMDLVALRQIPEMFVPRLDTQKAPCRFGGTDDHFRKRKDHTDQNAVDRTQQQNADKSTDKNKELRPTDLPQSCRQIKLRRAKQGRDHDCRQDRHRQITDKTGSAQQKNDHG